MKGEFNFSKNLSQILGVYLKELGFKKEGKKFRREKDAYIEEIYIQASRWNMPSAPHEFFIDLYLLSVKDEKISEIRLNRPSIIEIPHYYKKYMQNMLQGIEQDFENFSTEQKEECWRYMSSKKWMYSSEKELKSILNQAKGAIESIGVTFLDAVRKALIESESDYFDDTDHKKLIELEYALNWWK